MQNPITNNSTVTPLQDEHSAVQNDPEKTTTERPMDNDKNVERPLYSDTEENQPTLREAAEEVLSSFQELQTRLLDLYRK